MYVKTQSCNAFCFQRRLCIGYRLQNVAAPVHNCRLDAQNAIVTFITKSIICYVTFQVIQRRKDGSENFNQNWKQYTYGFGYLEGEFWLG